MRKFRSFILALLVWSTAAPSAAYADDSAVLERLAALEQEISILKRQLELKKEDEDKKKAESPVITASSKDGFSIKSPDDNFRLRVRGYLQADGRFFRDNEEGNPTDVLTTRRVRPTFEGTVFKDFDYSIVTEFAGGSGTLLDAFLEYKYLPEAKIKVGKFKPPVGLERLQSGTAIAFVERGFPTSFVPNRDVGAQLSGDLLEGKLSYAIGVFNGTPDGAASVDTDINNDKDVAARIFAHPFKGGDIASLSGLGLGVAGTWGHKEGASLPTIRSLGQASIFSYNSTAFADGPHRRLVPQFYYYWNSFGALGEYAISDQEVVRGAGISDRFENDAWQIILSYVLTGEDASYRGVTPRKPFSPKDGQWGAWELVGRYQELDIDDRVFTTGFANRNVSVDEAEAWGGGLNWYLNRNVKLVLDYEHTEFSGGALLRGDRETENAIFTRFQLSY